MQIINIEWAPNGDEDPVGCDNLFLVDVPDAKFDTLVGELEDSLDSYFEHVDEAETQSAQEIAETVMQNCGYHYIPIRSMRAIKV